MIPLFIRGRVRDLEALDVRGVDVAYVAGTLAKINRFVGHTPEPYSVAQHAVLVSALTEPGWAYEALHHDDTEAFVGDLASPIKKICPGFKQLEAKVRARLAPVFGLARVEPRAIKAWDLEARLLEQWVLQGRRDVPKPSAFALSCADLLRPCHWTTARDLFVFQHERLAAREGK